MINLNRYADQLGEPARYFVEAEGREVPLVVEHATGVPKYAVVDDRLVPYAEWRSSHGPANGASRSITLRSSDGTFSAGVRIDPPSPES